MLYLCNGCLNNNFKNEPPSNLEQRINNYYSLLKDRQFESCYHFWDTNIVGSKEQFVSYTNRSSFNITSYEIKKITIDLQRAKAVMTISIREDGNNYETITSDLWMLKGGQWYLMDFGRGEGSDTVREFNYPDDYNKSEEGTK